MQQRKWAVVIALAATLSLGLGACSSNKGGDAGQSSNGSTASTEQGVDSEAPVVDRDPDFPLPTVTGGFGVDPVITPVDEAPPTEITCKLLTPGEGTEVHEDGIVTVNYAGVLWDGTPFDSSFLRGTPATFSLNAVIPGWKYGLAGSQVGDRVLLVVPPQWGYGEKGQGDIPPNSTLVFVVDILAAPGSDFSALSEAEVTDNALPDGLLVDGALGEQPIIGFEEGAAEPEQEVEVIVAEGKGQVITEADTVVYHYSGAYWGTPNKVDSTWSSGPMTLPARDSVFLGQHVGSRIAMIFPEDGANEPATVMVVDILAAYQ